MAKTLTKRASLADNAFDVQLLEAFFARDCGHAEAATLTFDINGLYVQVILREAVPLGSCRDAKMREALTHACEMMLAWAAFGES